MAICKPAFLYNLIFTRDRRKFKLDFFLTLQCIKGLLYNLAMGYCLVGKILAHRLRKCLGVVGKQLV